MKILGRISIVFAAALMLAPPALADFAGTTSGTGATAAGISFSMLVNGYDDASANGSMAVSFVGAADRFVVAEARCIVVVDNSAFIVGRVISSGMPIAGDIAFSITYDAVDEFGWGVVPQLSCSEWLNPPALESTMLMSPLVGGDVWIHYLSPAERLARLIAELQAGATNVTSFVAKLESASASMDAGNTEAACNKLDAFANEVRAQAGKRLTDADAETLLRRTATIKTKGGCP